MTTVDKQYEGREKQRRRRMTKFKMDEISAVDRPAQSPALAVIMKREGDAEKQAPRGRRRPPFLDNKDEEEEENTEKRIVLTSDDEGHAHAVGINGMAREFGGGETMYAQGHIHPFTINDDGTVTIGAAEGHTHTVDVNTNSIMIKQNTSEQRGQKAKHGEGVGTSPTVKNAAVEGGGQDLEDNKMSETEKAAAEVAKKLEELNAKLAKAVAFGELSDVQKAHYAGLDEAGKAAYLAKDAAGRQADVEEVAKADAVVYKAHDGSEYRKSDDPRLVAMAKRADEQHEALRKSEEKRRDAEFSKRAETELANLPGKVETRVALLKAVDAIPDEAVRAEVADVLKAQNSKLAKAFTTVGTSEVSKAAAGDAQAELDELAKKYAADKGVNYFDAYDAVAKAHPDLYTKAVSA